MIEGGTVNGTRSISFLAQLHAAFSPFSSARRSASWPFGICNKRRKGHLGYQGAVGYEGVFVMFIIFSSSTTGFGKRILWNLRMRRLLTLFFVLFCCEC